MDMTDFDPNGPGVANGNYFGMPVDAEDARLVLVSVPWDVTTSYGEGTALAPDAIIGASLQVDLYDVHHPGGWRQGIATADIDEMIPLRSARLREDARRVIAHLEEGGTVTDDYVVRKIRRVNEGCAELNEKVYRETSAWLDKGKKVGLVGGDHSVPLGLIRALCERCPGLGILHIDAHADLREAYEGFSFSHASIMYNALKEADGLSALVQVGVRDFCDEELALARSEGRVTQFDDYALAAARFGGESWDAICARIVSRLPQKVYVSFDIDGLSPENCPHTGTPVPGGLSFHEAVRLLWHAVDSGREIVGFDLCEVTPCEDDSWDANVGARILYKLCNLTLLSK